MALTGIFKSINDKVFNVLELDNVILFLEFTLPVVISVMMGNYWFLLLMVTPFISAYAMLFIVSISRGGVNVAGDDPMVLSLCHLNDATHIIVEMILLVMFSNMK